MKLSRILLLTLLVAGKTIVAQDIVINEDFENVQLTDVLKKLRSRYKVKIAYDNQLVRDITVTQKFENVTLQDALAVIFTNTRLTHQFINGKVVIMPKPEPPAVVSRPVSNSAVTVSGIIKDEESGETLPNASIRIAGSSRGTITNTDGFFTLVQVPDTSTLIINYLGYQIRKIRLSELPALYNIQVDLKSELKVLDEVTITDQSEVPLEVKERVSKAAFDARALASLPSLGGQDMFRTLQLMPGVSSTNESSAGLVVRGSIPSQNLVLLDGFTIYHLDHFFGVFSALNPDIIKDVQIFKGGFDAKYGGRVSSVVDITGRSGSQKPKFNLGANLMSVHATGDIPISKRISLLFAFRRAYTDVIQSNLYKKLFAIARDTDEQIKRPVDIPKLDEAEPRFYFYDVNTKITYRPSKKDNISLSIYGGKDDLSSHRDTLLSIPANQVSYREGLSERTEWGNSGLSLRWGRQWNAKFYSNIKLSGSGFFRNYNFLYNYLFTTPDSTQAGNFGFNLQNKVEDSNISIDNELLISEKVALEFGFSGVEYNISNKTVVNTQTTDSTHNQGNLGSLYTTAKVNFTEKLNVSFGVRSSHHQVNKKWYNEPRLSASYKINNKLNLKSAIGRYYQFVNQVQYDDPYNGLQNFWVFSGNDIPVVESNHFILGATYKTEKFVVDVEAYYKDLEGVVEFNPVPYFVKEGNLDFPVFLAGRGRMRGVDILIQKETGIHKGWLSYSISRSLHAFPSIAKGTFFPSLNDQPHEIKLVNMVTLGKWHLSSTWMYGSGRPFPEYEIFYFTNENGNIEDLAVMKDRTNFSRLPDYHRLDIAGAYNFNAGKFSGQVGLSIFNVYARRNVKTRRLSIVSLQQTIGTPSQPLPQYRDLVLINFTPSLFVNVQF